MKACAGEVRKLECHFNSLKLEHVPRGQDVAVKELPQIVAQVLPVLARAIVEKFSQPSAIPEDEELGVPLASEQGNLPTTEQQESMDGPASEQCIPPTPTCWTN
jgi:hypothetical protein